MKNYNQGSTAAASAFKSWGIKVRMTVTDQIFTIKIARKNSDIIVMIVKT